MGKKMTTEEFIKRAKEVHGDKYDYSKVEYIGGHTKVCITCPVHGEFYQTPNHHLKGCGCPKCGRDKTKAIATSKRYTTEGWIKQAKQIHGDKYDYSKVEYVNAKTKVCIICPIHGEFWQLPDGHLHGQGCPKCVGKHKTTEEFINEARMVHGDKYDYSRTEYINTNVKVRIVCPTHGEFSQNPSAHLSGAGCPKCGNIKLGEAKKHKTEGFVARLKSIYGNKYDYSKVEYKNSSTRVSLICPKHGEFSIRPDCALNKRNVDKGQCCPRCNNSPKNMTTEEFIQRAKEIHGDKYDYSKTIYTKSNANVCIICPKHGEFWMPASRHLNGAGCKKCWFPNAYMTTEEFIRKAREIHGDKYDYSKVNYVDSITKVCIICPKHGEFWQQPSLHLTGSGCSKCAREKMWEKRKITTEEWIKEARNIHGDKYDYSKVNYINSKTKVCIICPKHGEFMMFPNNHLRGQGCTKCLYPNANMTTEEFIEKAKKVHGDKYDYSKVEYVNTKTKVCIICHEKDKFGREHGEFWKTPQEHLNGQGCPKCVGKYKMNTDEFIETANLIHNNKYDYSKVEFKNDKTKVCIICPEHGEFWQLPTHHLRGVGCPNCSGLRKEYKFNLLQEFESEYAFRAFLANNDINILQVILRNIEPKFEPIKRDIEKALMNVDDADPIQSLEDKYRNEDEEDNENEVETIDSKPIFEGIDLDDDEAVNAVLTAKVERSVEDKDEKEPTIEDVVKNNEQELQVINRIEHMLTPEDREYIMKKFLNDKRRAWIAERESKLNK